MTRKDGEVGMKEIIIEVPDRFGQELKPEKVNSEIKGELVRCEYCRHYGYNDMTNVDGFCYCLKRHEYPNPDWFCADGKRRETND